MNKLKLLTISLILAMSLSLAAVSYNVAARPLYATSPTLGAAGSYSVLGGQTVTNTGGSSMPGDLGVSPGSAIANTGSLVVGPPGTTHAADSNAAEAQLANTAAFGALDQGCDTTFPGAVADLTGLNLVPGVYCATSFSLTGTLTLNGGAGDVWIFKSDSDLITSGTANVQGGDPCNVWWREVSSATLGTNTSLIGNILASTSISLATGASLNGRALAQTGQVSLDSNTITGAGCLTSSSAATATATSTSQPSGPTATVTSTGQPSGPTATQGSSSSSEDESGATATLLPVVTGLPGSGGGPIQNESSPWGLVIIIAFIVVAVLFLGIRIYRNTYFPKQ
jgi:hypothetical protein